MNHRHAPDSLIATFASESSRLGRKSDASQLAAVAELDNVRSKLIDASTRRGIAAFLPFARAPRTAIQGLYLWGGVGRGKTWLMDLFYASLPFKDKRRRHFHRFMHDVHAELKKVEGRESPIDVVAARLASQFRVLCFDELFVTDIADAMILGTLFGGLFERRVTLVITSNVEPHDLYQGGLQRARFLPAIALLEEHTEVINVDGGTDYRLRQLDSAGLYLPASAADTESRLASLFENLGGRNGTRSTQLQIAGRPIPVRHLASTVAWFDFEALCEGPRSQDDYIELAREFPAVIVSGVPVLDQTLDNAARRFIALVDEFYDRGVKLIVSAAADPQHLYRGQKLSQAFARTESRLIEMQSSDYLGRPHLA